MWENGCSRGLQHMLSRGVKPWASQSTLKQRTEYQRHPVNQPRFTSRETEVQPVTKQAGVGSWPSSHCTTLSFEDDDDQTHDF